MGSATGSVVGEPGSEDIMRRRVWVVSDNFPYKVSCLLSTRCSIVGMLLNARWICSFLMWFSLTSFQLMRMMLRIVEWEIFKQPT